MPKRNFMKLLEAQWEQGKKVCVGLDSRYDRLPDMNTTGPPSALISMFNQQIVDATAPYAAAYKLQLAFYEAVPGGIDMALKTVDYIHSTHPHLAVIADGKRGDIGSSNQGYIDAYLGANGFDALTINPYLGFASGLEPFLKLENKGPIVLCRTSNDGAAEFQDMKVALDDTQMRQLAPDDSQRRKLIEANSNSGPRREIPFYQCVAARVVNHWNQNNNCMLVMGATSSAELTTIRDIFPDIPLLIPGIGAQGGNLEATVTAARHRYIVNSSRGIIFAYSSSEYAGSNFAEAAGAAAKKLHEQIREVETNVTSNA